MTANVACRVPTQREIMIAGVLCEATQIAQDTTISVPPSHGLPHLKRVARFSRYLAQFEEVDQDVAELSGLFHDLRFWDEDERKARKLNIPSEQTGKKDVRQVLQELAKKHSWPSQSEREYILSAILNHSKIPTLDKQVSPLLRVLRDADRLSRLGRDGLLSILEANKNYKVPFYKDGEGIIWHFDTPLIRNEDIKSAIGDIRACLSWWTIMETKRGMRMFRELCGVNIALLEAFTSCRNMQDYDFWIRWISQLPES